MSVTAIQIAGGAIALAVGSGLGVIVWWVKEKLNP